MKPRILFLVASDYDRLKKKGVANIILDRNEFGFFEKVVTVHPSASQNQTLDLSPENKVIEFKEFLIPGLSRIKLFRYPHHLFHFVGVFLKTLKIIKKERINLIRATDPLFTGFLAWALTRFCSIPYCVSIHTNYDKVYYLDPRIGGSFLGSRSLARRIENFVLKRAGRVMPISHFIGEILQKRGVNQSKIRVIHHGIDMSPFKTNSQTTIRERFDIPADKKIITFVGRLHNDNFVHDIVKVAHQLKNNRSDFVVLLIGGGDESENLDAYINKNNLQNHVRLLGFQQKEVVLPILQESLISYCPLGGFSLVEACAAGCAMIAYKVDWQSEILKTGETGWVLDEGDVEGLFRVTSDLLDHPEKAKQIGKNVQDWVFEKHNIHYTSNAKKEAYKEVLAMKVQ